MQHASKEFSRDSKVRRVQVIRDGRPRIVEGSPHAVSAEDQSLRDKRILAPRLGFLVAGFPIVAPVGVP